MPVGQPLSSAKRLAFVCLLFKQTKLVLACAKIPVWSFIFLIFSSVVYGYVIQHAKCQLINPICVF